MQMRSGLTRFFALYGLLGLLVLLFACTAPATQAPATTEATAFPTKEPTQTITPRPTLNAMPEATTVLYLEVDKADLLGVTVTFWHPFTGDTAERLREMAQNFNEENDLGIRVEVFSMGAAGALNERMMKDMAEDETKSSEPQIGQHLSTTKTEKKSKCPICGDDAKYIRQYNKHYCVKCGRYLI